MTLDLMCQEQFRNKGMGVGILEWEDHVGPGREEKDKGETMERDI